jgi:hypothetical protein
MNSNEAVCNALCWVSDLGAQQLPDARSPRKSKNVVYSPADVNPWTLATLERSRELMRHDHIGEAIAGELMEDGSIGSGMNNGESCT